MSGKEKLKQIATPSDRDALKELNWRIKNRDILAEQDKVKIKELKNNVRPAKP